MDMFIGQFFDNYYIEQIYLNIMKIATWNIGGGFVYSEESSAYDVLDLDYFISVLRDVIADVICLQEVHYVSDCDNQAALIANALGMRHVVFPHAPSHMLKENQLSIAILSKFQLDEASLNLVSNPGVVAEYKGKIVDLNYEDDGFLCKGLYDDGFTQLVPHGGTDWHDQAIDKILVSKEWGLVPGSAKILRDGKADHFLCVAEVELL